MFFFLKATFVFKVLAAAVGTAAFLVALQVVEVKRWVAGAGNVLRKQVLQVL